MIFLPGNAMARIEQYSDVLQRAIRYVLKTDFSALKDGKYAIEGDKMYANLFHLTSKSLEQTAPELHRKYIDVQYWISGQEQCGIAPAENVGTLVQQNEEEDLYLYNGVKDERFVYAWAGCIAIFFPEDAHRPGVMCGNEPQQYRKVVVKVSVDLL